KRSRTACTRAARVRSASAGGARVRRRSADRTGTRGSRRAGEGDSHYNFRMSILKVARMGHPVLRAKARTVDKHELRGAALQRLIDDMLEPMAEYHGVGLAAPQVQEGLRLFVAALDADDDGDGDGVRDAEPAGIVY